MKPPYSKHILTVPFLLALCYVPGMWGEGGTPGNSWWGCAAGFPNPNPISDQKMSFSTPVFRPGL